MVVMVSCGDLPWTVASLLRELGIVYLGERSTVLLKCAARNARADTGKELIKNPRVMSASKVRKYMRKCEEGSVHL